MWGKRYPSEPIIICALRVREGLPMNMASFFKPWVEKSPDKTAIIFEDRRISYAEFDKLVNA